ncbi:MULTISPECIES: AraC family transcriptional regulator [Actinopolyspora]|uniref:AraC-like ligand binding domain-containing protein n=1 Tax=Actinopolyspora saharensis TaxID=995062 RepID=A0A1H0YNJ0_9ACTN|nr:MULTISPECIES: AraC family transcriptional regulator [Actinopolyspora]SDQ16710.1 AraC-like ligand binding domain-containing protein [Actinopolyspora saharensis]
MLDFAGDLMTRGREVAVARSHGVDENMVRAHRHDYFEIYFLEAGTRYHGTDQELYRIEQSELIIFPPGVEHFSYGDAGVPFRRVVVYFRPEAVLYAHVLEAVAGQVCVVRPGGESLRAVENVVEELLTAQDVLGDGAQDEMRLLVTQLLVKLMRAERRDARLARRAGRIADVIYHLHDHYAEPIDLTTLAERFFSSPFYLSREFKKHTGSTIIGYVNGLRIGRAERLLQETARPVSRISAEVGFANVSHFNRVFRARTGMSPSQFRGREKARERA